MYPLTPAQEELTDARSVVLPGMKIQPAARRHHVFAKPPPQQLGDDMFKPQRQRVGVGGEAEERARGNFLFKAMR